MDIDDSPEGVSMARLLQKVFKLITMSNAGISEAESLINDLKNIKVPSFMDTLSRENTQIKPIGLLREVINRCTNPDIVRLATEEVERINRTIEFELIDSVNSAMKSRIKDSIRLAYSDLGDFYFLSGHFSKAVDSYKFSMDNISNTTQLISASRNCYFALMHQALQNNLMPSTNGIAIGSNLQPTIENIRKRCNVVIGSARSEERKFSEKEIQQTLTQLKYYHLVESILFENFHEAAVCFFALLGEELAECDDLLQKDFILFGTVAALVSFERKDFVTQICKLNLSSITAGNNLCRRVLDSWRSLDFDTLFSCLNELDQACRGNILFAGQMETLCQRIKLKQLVFYFKPYNCISFETLESISGISIDKLARSYTHFLQQLDMKIDVQNHCLVKKLPQRMQRILEQLAKAKEDAVELLEFTNLSKAFLKERDEAEASLLASARDIHQTDYMEIDDFTSH